MITSILLSDVVNIEFFKFLLCTLVARSIHERPRSSLVVRYGADPIVLRNSQWFSGYSDYDVGTVSNKASHVITPNKNTPTSQETELARI